MPFLFKSFAHCIMSCHVNLPCPHQAVIHLEGEIIKWPFWRPTGIQLWGSPLALDARADQSLTADPLQRIWRWVRITAKEGHRNRQGQRTPSVSVPKRECESTVKDGRTCPSPRWRRASSKVKCKVEWSRRTQDRGTVVLGEQRTLSRVLKLSDNIVESWPL